MSRFVSEARDFLPAGEPRPIFTTRDLLKALGVVDSGRGEQEGAVSAWLRANAPHQVLAASLRLDGFLGEGETANVSNNLSNEPRRTGPDDGGRTVAETAADLHRHGRRRTTADPPGRRSAGS